MAAAEQGGSALAASSCLVVKEGDTVVLDENNEKQSFLKAKASGWTFRVGRNNVSLAPLLGAPYGAMFQLSADGSQLERVTQAPQEEVTDVTDTVKDNSTLFDRNTENQKMDKDQIEALKKSGKSGEEIIQQLCSSSSTFEQKTEFAQDKYKRKKAKKYLLRITVRRPTARSLCEAYFGKGPERVFNLRYDSLSILMSLANVCPGQTVLVVDTCAGVVTAAVAERLSGYGQVCAAYTERIPQLDAARMLNLDAKQAAAVCSASLASLRQAKDRLATATPTAAASSQQQQQGATASSAAAAPEAAPADVAMAEAAGSAAPQEGAEGGEAGKADGSAAAGPGPSSSAASASLPKLGHAASPELLAQLVQRGFSSCILASPRIHPTTLLAAVLPLLAPSASFAVYSQWLPPLGEAQQALQASRQAVMVQVQESWLRPHQVLPARTHPEMMCDGTGGYVLSGTKVETSDSRPIVLPGQQMAASATGAPQGQGGQGEGQQGQGYGNGNGGRGGWGQQGRGRGGRGGGNGGRGRGGNKRARQ